MHFPFDLSKSNSPPRLSDRIGKSVVIKNPAEAPVQQLPKVNTTKRNNKMDGHNGDQSEGWATVLSISSDDSNSLSSLHI